MKAGDTVKTMYAGQEVSAVVKAVGEKSIDVLVTAADGSTFVRTSLVEGNKDEALHEGQYRVK